MDALKAALRAHGICPEADKLILMEKYLECLKEFNQVMDLTNVPEENWPERHIADSLAPLSLVALPPEALVADVGTGAGFPGMPAAIMYPQRHFTLVDALQKRCAFLEEAVRRLGLLNVRVVCARAEEFGRDAQYREKFDAVLTRAVAKVNVLAEYMLPLLKIGGQALCWKGPRGEEEIPDGDAAARVMGGGPWRRVDVPGFEEERMLLVCEKIEKTPEKYPRRVGVPAKRPVTGK